jgi:hypothetical protein
MSLSEYHGPSNSKQMFPFLVGETISGVFVSGAHMHLVFSDGTALTLCSIGGGAPAFWVDGAATVKDKLSRLEAQLVGVSEELRDVLRVAGASEAPDA